MWGLYTTTFQDQLPSQKQLYLAGTLVTGTNQPFDFTPGVGSYAVRITRVRKAGLTISETQDRHAENMDGFLGD